MSNSNGDGEHGVHTHKTTVLTVVYDHETCLVSLGVKDAPCGLLQMMLNEAMRQLEEQRRAAMAIELQRQMRQAAADQAVADAVRRGTGRG